MNPEFRRNVLLELSLHRLIAMPALLLMIFILSDLIGWAGLITRSAQAAMGALLILWGSRLAADSIVGEVAARTWDGQRMSTLGPLSIGIGKLFGSTVYVWYGAAICLAAAVFDRGETFDLTLRIWLVGLFVQAVALFVSLLFLRLRPQQMRFQVAQAQFAGLGAGALYWKFLSSDRSVGEWYGVAVDQDMFLLVSALIFLGWCWIGIYRLLHAELQFRGHPVGWTGFVLFCAVYAGGFEFGVLFNGVDISGVDEAAVVLRLRMAFLAAVGLTWIAAFAEPKGFVGLRRWISFIRAGDIRRSLEATPGWIPGGLVAVLLGLTVVVLWWSTPDLSYVFQRAPAMASLGAFVVAVLLFLLRDIGLMHLFTLDGRARRGYLTALVYLTALYAIIPPILAALELPDLALMLVPNPIGDPFRIVLPALAQAVLVGGLLVIRWRRIARTMDAAG